MNPLIAAILVGIALGAVIGKRKEIWQQMDGVILAYLLPILFLFTGSGFKLESLESTEKIFGILSIISLVTLGVSYSLARWVLKLDGEMRLGFVILSTCSNTGHGLMLLQAGDPLPEVSKLAIGAFYQGFLVVVFLPQLLTAKGGWREAIPAAAKMIAFHPVSVSCIVGFGIAVNPIISASYLGVLWLRQLIGKLKKWDRTGPLWDWKPLAVLTAIAFGVYLSNQAQAPYVKWYAIVVTFVTAITIGNKMLTQKMEGGHWKVVAGVMFSGLVLEPFFVGLPLAKLFGCNYAEGYVIAYMKSQPPAYLGMLWLRGGKFGKLPVSEWAFALQALAAYGLAVFFPTILQMFFS